MPKDSITNTYEAARQQQVELNKKRFQDLGILNISKSLAEVTNSEKKSQQRLPKPRSNSIQVLSEPRRSSRARNPVPSYRDDVGIELPSMRKRSRSSSFGSYVARPLDEVKEATRDQRDRAFMSAMELQSNLKSGNPSFVKSMVRSHVYSCFWLGLPTKFCDDHLPNALRDVVLEDENGEKYEAVYIGKRTGLSGGWRAFALEHKLDDGDALVFELIEPAKFKIYTVRAFPLASQEQSEDIGEKEGISGAKKTSKRMKKQSEDIGEKEGISGAKKTSKRTKKLDLQSDQSQKSRKSMVDETDELACAPKLPPDSEVNTEVRSEDENAIGFDSQKIQKKGKSLDASGSKKVDMVKESDRCAPRKPRKKPAPKLFSKRA